MIFIDTSAFYALEVEDDKNHEKASSFLQIIKKGTYGALVTSDYVIDETLTLLRIKHGVIPALKFLDKVRKSKSIKIVWVDETVFNMACEYFKRNKKLEWSFTDCTSFAIMKLLDIKYTFTFDKNFEEAGFVKLP